MVAVASDEKRREVAENIRYLTIRPHIRYKEQFFDELAETVVGFEDYHDFNDVLNKLADLIDRPVCELEGHPGAQYGRCSHCGAFVRRDAATDCTDEIPVKFCPNCGAEVFAGAY